MSDLAYKITRILERYEVSQDGRIFSLNYNHTGMKKELSYLQTPNGYLQVSLFIDGKKIPASVHRLTALVHIPNPDGKPCVNHKDLNKSNNRSSNLEWVTFSENSAHAVRNGRHAWANPSPGHREKVREACRVTGLANRGMHRGPHT